MSLDETLETMIRKAVREEMQAIIHEDRLLTPKQAAEILGYTDVGSVHRLAREGQLEKVNLGEQSPRFRSSDVQRLVLKGIG